MHFSQFQKATLFGWPQKSSSTSGFTGARGYWWLGLMDFCNFFITYVFEIKESIFCSFTKLPCLGDLEIPGQLPVLQVLEGTDDWVLWIFVISSFLTFSRSRNPFFAVSQSYHVWMTSKIQNNFRFKRYTQRYWWLCLMDFHNIFTIYVFEAKQSIPDIPAELPCLGDL